MHTLWVDRDTLLIVSQLRCVTLLAADTHGYQNKCMVPSSHFRFQPSYCSQEAYLHWVQMRLINQALNFFPSVAAIFYLLPLHEIQEFPTLLAFLLHLEYFWKIVISDIKQLIFFFSEWVNIFVFIKFFISKCNPGEVCKLTQIWASIKQTQGYSMNKNYISLNLYSLSGRENTLLKGQMKCQSHQCGLPW